MQANNKQLRTRVKVCGMSEPDNVRQVVACGVDAIGMILHANSPRTISLDQAIMIRQVVPAFVSLVGVFVDCDVQKINDYAQAIDLDLIQLHGNETNEFGAGLAKPFIKAIRAQTKEQVSRQTKQYPDARAFLLDPYVKGQHGGTGKHLDLSLWPSGCQKPLILAGGLNPEIVSDAIQQVAPFAVDLNSGIEDSPGLKNIDLLKRALTEIS